MIKKTGFLLLLLIVAFFFSLKWGATTLSWSGLFGLFQAKEQNSQLQLLLFSLRIPRTFAALYVGAALGLSGAVLQSLLRNPLADSYTLGLSGGSSLGAVLTLYFGF